MKKRVFTITDHSLYDLCEIITSPGRKVFYFPSQEVLNAFVSLIPASTSYVLLDSGKSGFFNYASGVMDNLLCVESSGRGLDIPSDRWIFYDINPDKVHQFLRSPGENLIFTRRKPPLY